MRFYKKFEKMAEDGAPWNNVVEWFEGEDKMLNPLMSEALFALYDEDKILFGQFLKAEQKFQEFYEKADRGLAYWLFETTLVYTIFKAWIPKTCVEWEAKYPPKEKDVKTRLERHKIKNYQNKTCDLIVTSNGKKKCLFEAKWWQNKQKKTVNGLKEDIIKMVRWKKGERCFLMTFWFSWIKGHWSGDIGDVKNFKKIKIDMQKYEIKPFYLGAFPTDYRRNKKIPPGESYFAMVVFEIVQSKA